MKDPVSDEAIKAMPDGSSHPFLFKNNDWIAEHFKSTIKRDARFKELKSLGYDPKITKTGKQFDPNK